MSSTLDADLCTSLLSSPTRQTHTASQQQQQQQQPTPSDGDNNARHFASVDATARGMSQTGAWKPALDRRQSWDSQEWKHDLQKRLQMTAAGSAGQGQAPTQAQSQGQGVGGGVGGEVGGGRQGQGQGFTEV